MLAQQQAVEQDYRRLQGEDDATVDQCFQAGLFIVCLECRGDDVGQPPCQGMAAASLLFHWLVASRPDAWIDYWPNWPALGTLLAMAFVGYALARRLSEIIATTLQKHYEKAGLETLIYRSIILALQAPVILFYGLSLGRQLH